MGRPQDKAAARRPPKPSEARRPAPAARPSPSTPRWAWLLLAAALLLAHGNAIPLGLAVDAPFLLSMSRVSGLDADDLHALFTRPYWWPLHSDDLYRPVTLLSFALSGGASTPDWFHHAVNVAWHGLNVWLLFRLAWRVHGGPVAAAAVASFLAVHPVGADAVANVAGRADLIAAACVLGGLILHARACEVARPLSSRVALGLVALAGVFSKENAVVLLPCLLLFDFAFADGGASWRGSLRAMWHRGRVSYGVVAAALLIAAVVRLVVLSDEMPHWQPFVDNPLAAAAWPSARATALAVLGTSTLLLLWPARLSADYSYDQLPVIVPGAPWAEHLAWVGTLAAFLFAAAFAWRFRLARPALFFWTFFFLGTRLPTANLLLTIGSVMAERFLYLPMAGFFGAVVALVFPLAARWGRPRVALGILAALLAALAARTAVRNRDWRDDESVWRAAISASPQSYKPYKGLARVMMQRGDVDAAIALFERSLAVLEKRPLPPLDRSSDLLLGAGEAYLAKGDALGRDGRTAEARAFYEKAHDVLRKAAETDRAANDRVRRLRVERGEQTDAVPDVGVLRIHQLLGAACLRLGDLAGAAEAFGWQRHLDPTHAAAYRELAETSRRAGRPADEAMFLLEAMILEPDDARVWDVLPEVLAREGIRGLGREGGRLRVDPREPALNALVARACPDLVAGLRRARREQAAAEAESICARNLGYRAR